MQIWPLPSLPIVLYCKGDHRQLLWPRCHWPLNRPGACFQLRILFVNFAVDKVPEDAVLRHFVDSVSRDSIFLIPVVMCAQGSVKATSLVLRIVACPWSPPSWDRPLRQSGKGRRRSVKSQSICFEWNLDCRLGRCHLYQ